MPMTIPPPERDGLSILICMTAIPCPAFGKVAIEGDIDSFAGMLWESLNEENKVSLFVRFIDIAAGQYETRIFNKNQ